MRLHELCLFSSFSCVKVGLFLQSLLLLLQRCYLFVVGFSAEKNKITEFVQLSWQP